LASPAEGFVPKMGGSLLTELMPGAEDPAYLNWRNLMPAH
jgi:hypothetical protein